MKTTQLSIALLFTWLLSPESLALNSKFAGIAGHTAIIFFVLGGGLVLFCTSQMYHPQLAASGFATDSQIFTQVWGRFSAGSILLGCRIPFLLFGATGVLVSAGFAFNEIFLYWFPNFLFAGLLLVLVCLVNFLPVRSVLMFQTLCVGVAMFAILLLAILGLTGEGMKSISFFAGNGTTNYWTMAGITVLPFLGIDLMEPGRRRSFALWGTFGFVLFHSLLVFLALRAVEPGRLAGSSIGYMLIARGVAGELGRQIMGLVVISGTLACVNGMFLLVRKGFSDMEAQGARPVLWGRPWAVSLFFAGIIEAMMMSGVAGEDRLETQIQGCLLLWIFYMAAKTVTSAHLLQISGQEKGMFSPLGGGALFALFVGLWLTNPEFVYITKFMALTVAGALLFSLFWTTRSRAFP